MLFFKQYLTRYARSIEERYALSVNIAENHLIFYVEFDKWPTSDRFTAAIDILLSSLSGTIADSESIPCTISPLLVDVINVVKCSVNKSKVSSCERMISISVFKNWLSWRLIGPHLCTLAVAVSYNNIWRTPREAFRYGGLQLLLLFTIASVVVVLPVVLLQLAVGQLSQQDSVGVWRAVPFFKGVGFLRLLISLLCSIYASLYTAICITYIFYTISQSIPFWDCVEVSELSPEIIGDVQDDELQYTYNATACLNETILAPVSGQPEYYVALVFIVIVLWVLFPFILFNPVKLMKKILYVLGPLVVLLWIIIISVIGDKNDVTSFSRSNDWVNFIRPNVWHGALVQALLSSQTAGGFLISSGDAIYANTDVQWTALIFVGVNILACWVGALFWFAISGGDEKLTGSLAVLMQMYKVAIEKNLNIAWPLLCFFMLTLSGIVTMLLCLLPLYDRFRRVGGYKWRRLSMGSSALGAAGAIASLVVGPQALAVLEDIAVPLLLSVAAVLEVSAFVFIYGWKILVEDVEFLIGGKLKKVWVMGWCAVPGIIIPITLWWTIVWFIEKQDWTEALWEPAIVVASFCTIFILFFALATISVVQQVQYDFLGKLKSSFKPSRHWGPRDPITHHYWLARRDEGGQSAPPMRYTHRQFGQFLGNSNFADVSRSNYIKDVSEVKNKGRSNSDDWIFVCRKQDVAKIYKEIYECRKRSKSLDWAIPVKEKLRKKYVKKKNRKFVKKLPNVSISSLQQKNNNIVDVKNDLV